MSCFGRIKSISPCILIFSRQYLCLWIDSICKIVLNLAGKIGTDKTDYMNFIVFILALMLALSEEATCILLFLN